MNPKLRGAPDCFASAMLVLDDSSIPPRSLGVLSHWLWTLAFGASVAAHGDARGRDGGVCEKVGDPMRVGISASFSPALIFLTTKRYTPFVVQRLVLLGSSVPRKPLLKCPFGLDDIRSRVRIRVHPHNGLCLLVECVEQPR